MAARFRIRTSQGQEISFASHEMFAEFVRSGELSPDDVVYDAETREWSSALTHPVVLQIEREMEESGSEPTAPAGEDRSPSDGEPEGDGREGPGGPRTDIGLELAPAAEGLTPEEEQAAFLKRMEAEREREREFDIDLEIQGFQMDQSPAGLVEEIGLAETPAEPAATRETRPRAKERRGPAPRGEQPRAAAAHAGALPGTVKKGKKKKAPRRRKSGGIGRYAPLLLVAAVVVGAGVYFGPELAGPSTGEGTEGSDPVELPPPPAPLIPDTEEALRERAQERFLTTTRALLRDLPPIPSIWLRGSYLAAPSDHPEVRGAWEEILTTIRQVRAGDSERYRAGYLRALDDARVEGSTRTLRLAAAVADFQGRAAPRDAHYDRVEALATAALRGHDALVEAEGTIAYEPAASTPVSGDPVIEAVGRDPEAQELLDEILDMILAELDEPDGPGNRENVGEWIWDGILGAVTR